MVPNWILDNTSLSVYDRAILIHIARQTIGYGKKSDGISISQFVKATGISERKVRRVIKNLKDNSYIIVTNQSLSNGGKSFNRYSLQKSPSEANPLRSKRPNGTVSQTYGVVSDRPIQNKIEQNKREGESFVISEEEKRSFIDHIIKTETVRSPSAYERKIRTQLNKNNAATMEMFHQWKKQQERTKAIKSFKRQYIGSVIHKETDNGVIHGRIVEVTDSGDGHHIITIDSMEKGITQIRANDLERVAQAIAANKT